MDTESEYQFLAELTTDEKVNIVLGILLGSDLTTLEEVETVGKAFIAQRVDKRAEALEKMRTWFDEGEKEK